MNTVLVMFCCNDPDNGNPTGRVGAVHVLLHNDLVWQLEGPVEEVVDGADRLAEQDQTPIVEHKGAVEIAGGCFPHRGWHSWVGNWCWEAAEMEPAVAAEMLNHLRRIEGWICTAGRKDLFDMWEQGKAFSAEDLRP